mgnify:CR=1 FL=1
MISTSRELDKPTRAYDCYSSNAQSNWRAGSNVLNETGTNKPDSKNGTMWYWNEATTMSITSRVQNTGRNGRVQRAVAGVLFVAALAVTGCAAPQAEVQTAAPAAAAPAIAMNGAPQKVSPEAYMSDFVDSGAAHQLIDVRTAEEYATGHIAGSINIPVQEIGARLGEISQDEPVVLYCRSGNRSGQAAQILDGAGFTGVYDLGGISSWQSAGYGLE